MLKKHCKKNKIPVKNLKIAKFPFGMGDLPRYDLVGNQFVERKSISIKSIRIQVIPHKSQRYETVGDWMIDKRGAITIKVSDMKNWKYNMLVGLHEMIEVLLCHDRGITDCIVTNFDKAFKGKGEPGDEPNAPYQEEHNFATGIERTMAAMLKVKWKEYDDAVNAL